MADALTVFAAGFAPRPITYRTIDFRTNEFRNLEGGNRFEPEEANPMIGYRGALRDMHEPDPSGSSWRRSYGSGTRAHQPPRDDSVRPHAARARACRAVVGSRVAGPPGIRALDHGRSALCPLPPRAIRRALRRDLDRLERSHPAPARRRPRLRAPRRALRRARSSGGRLPASSFRRRAPSASRRRSAARHRPSTPSTPRSSSEPASTPISVNIDVVDRARSLIAAAETRLLLDRARTGVR